MKGVGDGTIGKGGLSAVLRVSRSTTSLKGRPLRKRPFLLPRASQGRGLGPGLSLGGGKGGRIKGAHQNNRPAGLAATRRTKQRPSQCVRVCVFPHVCLCVSPARVYVKHHKPGQEKRERVRRRGTLAKQGQHGNGLAFLAPAPHTNAHLSHRTRRGERGNKRSEGKRSSIHARHSLLQPNRFKLTSKQQVESTQRAMNHYTCCIEMSLQQCTSNLLKMNGKKAQVFSSSKSGRS